MSEWVSQFSYPLAPADERVFDAVVGTHGHAIATWLTTTHRDEIAAESEGVVRFIGRWTESPPSLETAWDLAFGAAQMSLKSPRVNPIQVAVQLALRLTECGQPGTWKATLPAATLRLGPMLLPAVVAIRASFDGRRGRVHATTSEGTTLHASRESDGRGWVADNVELLPCVGVNRSVALLAEHAVPMRWEGEEAFVGATPVDSISEAMVSDFGHGLEVLSRYAPMYLPWVERVIRGIVVCPAEAAFRVESGSAEDAPGVIHASYPLTEMDIAEILVHECAHQYFYMLERVGPVDDGSDSQLYWSPPIRMNRPLSRVLMAYHALANVRLYYASVRERGGDVVYVDANEPEMIEAVADLDRPLRGNSALTAFGRGLYEPLAEQIAALPVSPLVSSAT